MVRCKCSIYGSFYYYDYHYYQPSFLQKNRDTGENWALNDDEMYSFISTPEWLRILFLIKNSS